jgi:ATP-dependent DNA ligase
MLATLTRSLPVDERLYEPKWDGFRCVAFRSGGETLLSSRNQRPLDRYFPEVVEGLLALRQDRLVLDGEIVVSGPNGLDFASLMLRLHPSPSRVLRLRTETPASFVVFDVLAAGRTDLRSIPLEERRAILGDVVAAAGGFIVTSPATRQRELAVSWLERLAGGGVDGVVAKDLRSQYEAGRRSASRLKVKPIRTADCVVGGFRLSQNEVSVSSLLLGVYDDNAELRHVGVAASFSAAQRTVLLDELRPAVTSLDGHPWEHGFALERGPMGRLKGSAGAWDPATMALDWVPVRPERVCEVAYDHIDATMRMRHPARFGRWGPERDARSCTFDQFDVGRPSPAPLLGGL